MKRIVSLELNEVNFDFIQKFCDLGLLPNFSQLLGKYQLFETVAEDSYPLLEPWIQWPTVYSGLTYAQHGVFRLGDIMGTEHDQIWEALERRGYKVGAVSPMNAANRCTRPDFFIPDPWTVTEVSGSKNLQDLYAIIRDVVNSNAHDERSSMGIGRRLLPHLVRYASARHMLDYTKTLWQSVTHRSARAIFLDYFLADVFINLVREHSTDFSSLFLNAAAHIQHHHMFDSAAYEGTNRNPSWYSTARNDGWDPLLAVYRAYDRILQSVLCLSNTRVLITSGLSQVPNPKMIYQYRLKDHAATLTRLGVLNGHVIPRMSRDFLLEFPDLISAQRAKDELSKIWCAGAPIFRYEDRGLSLFCQVAYFGPVEAFAAVHVGGSTVDLRDDMVLVSIENGVHRTIGYHIDTSIGRDSPEDRHHIPLTEIFQKIIRGFPSLPLVEWAA